MLIVFHGSHAIAVVTDRHVRQTIFTDLRYRDQIVRTTASLSFYWQLAARGDSSMQQQKATWQRQSDLPHFKWIASQL